MGAGFDDVMTNIHQQHVVIAVSHRLARQALYERISAFVPLRAPMTLDSMVELICFL
jgi:hypothetical protein